MVHEVGKLVATLESVRSVLMRPAKIQISLRIRAESSLGPIWIAKEAAFFHTDIKDLDQTAHMHM